MLLNNPESIAYTIIRAEPSSVREALDKVREFLPDAYVRRVFNPDQRFVVTFQPPRDQVFLDAVRDFVLFLDGVPGIIESATHIGMLMAGTPTSRLPRDVGVSWTFFNTQPRLDMPELLQLCREFDRAKGIVQVAQMVGRFKLGLVQMFDQNNVSDLIESDASMNAALVRLRVMPDELLCEVCP